MVTDPCVVGDNVRCRLCDTIGSDTRESVSPDWVVMVTCVISEIMFVEGRHNR